MRSFDAYQDGLRWLLHQLGREHRDYPEALVLQARLQESITNAQEYGDDETRRADRAQILDALNALALRALGVSFNELCEGQEPKVSAPETESVRGLLEAMGYRITDMRTVGASSYFLCDVKWGAEIGQEVVHFVGRKPTPVDIAAINDAVVSHDAVRGVLLTKEPLSQALCELASQRKRIRYYALDEFTDRLADFRPYLERLIADYEASEIPQYYVPLSVEATVGEDREPQVFKPIESYVDTWLAEPGRNHLSILGDFGSGKTWFCQRYAYLVAKRYLDDPAHNRIPVLITLHDYSRAYDVEQLITDAIANRYKVSLAAGYKTFAQLNQAGRLLLIFDGFDEMERRVSDYRTTVDNFWELAKAVSPNSKVLLTCRTAYFRHRNEEEETLIPRQRRISVVTENQVIDLRGRQGFEVVHLLDLDDGDIRLALQKRLPASWEPVHEKIQELTNLRDLASRPVLLDMIVKTLPQIRDARQINQATLYETYVDGLLKRRWSEDTDYTSPRDRLFFMQELAWEMYTSQRLTIPFSEFPGRVTGYFGLKNDPERAAFFERDMRTQSYLVRDEAGNYQFAHKSFMEYFVARKLAASAIDPQVSPDDCLRCWRVQPLTPEIRDFLRCMISDLAPLWRLVEATKNQSFTRVGYAGGNSLTLLAFLDKDNLHHKDFSNAVLVGADVKYTNLQASRFDGADLSQASLTSTCLADTSFRRCILNGVDIREIAWPHSLRYSQTGRLLAVGSRDNQIRLYRTDDYVLTRFLAGHRHAIWALEFDPEERYLYSGSNDNTVRLWDLISGKEVRVFRGHNNYVSSICFVRQPGMLVSAGWDGTVRTWDAATGTQLACIQVTPERLQSIASIPNSDIVVAGSWDGRIYAIDVCDRVVLQRSASLGSVVYAVGVSVDHQVVIGLHNGVIWIGDAHTGSLGSSWVSDTKQLLDIAVWHDMVASANRDKTVKIWRIGQERPIASFAGHGHWITRVAFHPAGSQLASGSTDNTIRIWDVAEGKCLAVLPQVLLCAGMQIGEAVGLDAIASDNKTTLRTWLIERGARE